MVYKLKILLIALILFYFIEFNNAQSSAFVILTQESCGADWLAKLINLHPIYSQTKIDFYSPVDRQSFFKQITQHNACEVLNEHFWSKGRGLIINYNEEKTLSLINCFKEKNVKIIELYRNVWNRTLAIMLEESCYERFGENRCTTEDDYYTVLDGRKVLEKMQASMQGPLYYTHKLSSMQINYYRIYFETIRESNQIKKLFEFLSIESNVIIDIPLIDRFSSLDYEKFILNSFEFKYFIRINGGYLAFHII
eukprot:TRINITY_DN377_c6_g1_i1.p1 TRINITY_DN377_c6_g1~~TRINITY_DN377_c6_g1_i1.p1  ORF type:complete len:252 (+),score=63.64 TRINITY_DN377_c6_g1_i1:54-809(+)